MKDIKEKHRYSQHYLDVIDLKNINLHDIPIEEGLTIIPRYAKKVLVEHDHEAERMFRDRGQRREIVFANCECLLLLITLVCYSIEYIFRNEILTLQHQEFT